MKTPQVLSEATTRSKIRTYDTETFRESFMQPAQALDTMLKEDFGKFFIVKVEDMFRLMKLPVPPCRATNHTCIYLTAGEAVMTIGSETYTIKKNGILIVPAGQVFSFQNLDINEGFLCHFHPDILARKYHHDLLKDFEFLNVWSNPCIHLDAETSQFILPLFQRLLFDYTHKGIKNRDIIESYLVALLCELKGAYRPSPNNAHSAAVIIANKFKELLLANFKTTHQVTDYAALLHISPNHLNKSVKAATGKSTAKWIDEAIILEAKVLLYQSTLSISEIALEVGHPDPSYFSRLFKKYTGVTPVAFRKRIEKS